MTLRLCASTNRCPTCSRVLHQRLHGQLIVPVPHDLLQNGAEVGDAFGSDLGVVEADNKEIPKKGNILEKKRTLNLMTAKNF